MIQAARYTWPILGLSYNDLMGMSYGEILDVVEELTKAMGGSLPTEVSSKTPMGW